MSQLEYIKLGKFVFYYFNRDELGEIWKDIFELEEYRMDLRKSDPLILDVGAHLGVATIYFKSVYPKARILAFEPNPRIFELLKLNIEANNIDNVEIFEVAAADKQAKVPLYIDVVSENPWTWRDSLVKNVWDGKHPLVPVMVQGIRLSKYIDQPIDLLKLDIEGAEGMVLNECKEQLFQVKNLILEFHGTPKTNPTNRLVDVVRLLKSTGFQLTYYYADEEKTWEEIEAEGDEIVLIKGVRG